VQGVFEEEDDQENTINPSSPARIIRPADQICRENPGSNLRFNYFAGSKRPAWRDH
jgi:hypothetical protein